jgi:hypothetical protein
MKSKDCVACPFYNWSFANAQGCSESEYYLFLAIEEGDSELFLKISAN